MDIKETEKVFLTVCMYILPVTKALVTTVCVVVVYTSIFLSNFSCSVWRSLESAKYNKIKNKILFYLNVILQHF